MNGSAGSGINSKDDILREIILGKKPADYGINSPVWSGRAVIELARIEWGIEIQKSAAHRVLQKIGLSRKKGGKLPKQTI